MENYFLCNVEDLQYNEQIFGLKKNIFVLKI